jgi:hypothetical protein
LLVGIVFIFFGLLVFGFCFDLGERHGLKVLVHLSRLVLGAGWLSLVVGALFW